MKYLIYLLFVLLISPKFSLAWDDTKYDTVEVRWPNGNLKEYYTRYWFLGNEKGFRPDGLYNSYFENGLLKEQGNYKQNSKNGIWINWDSTGVKIEETNFFENEKDGRYIKWHPESSINIIGYYKQNMKNGLWIFRGHSYDLNNPDLNIDSVNYYYDGPLLAKLEGPQGKWLHDSAQYYGEELDLHIEWKRHNSTNWLTNYKWFYIGKKVNGKKEGRWIRYADTGEIIEIDYYKDGEKVILE